MEFLKAHQLNIMLFMSGICGILALLALLTKSLSPQRRRILATIELSAMLLLFSDRYAYIFRGNVSELGWWMVRISNFLVFFLTLFIPFMLTLYLIDLYTNEGGLTRVPQPLQACRGVFVAGVILLLISQFTGLYYTFDELNQYQRSAWLPLSYVAPLLMALLQQSVVLRYRKRVSRLIFISLMLNTFTPFVASIVQLFFYGVSLTNLTINGVSIALYIFALYDLNEALRKSRQREIDVLERERLNQQVLFEQTAEALVNAIDAKDQYTHGHSSRVAEYSLQIAREAGKSEEELREIYYAALLHDVGKIGVPDQIINKVGKLTEEEYAQMKLHPVYGNNILSRIQQLPNFGIGAKYHHERYDGKGYPEGLVGEDIPEIARIIGVADAYDAMASRRSYRSSLPQHLVREELVKGIGTQFDPEFARIMIRLLDRDVQYNMQDHYEGKDSTIEHPVQISTRYTDILDGILINDKMDRIHLHSVPAPGYNGEAGLPTLIIFDALDGRVHEDEPSQKTLSYFEYARIRFDGLVTEGNIRKSETLVQDRSRIEMASEEHPVLTDYEIELVRMKDHAMVRIWNNMRSVRTILALPDSSHFTYAAIRGEHCTIDRVHAEQDEKSILEDYIPRIAEEISYIRGCPEGDIPNIQIDSWRMVSTRGVPIEDGLKLTFHSQSLPTARLVWHCPFVLIFTSKDGTVTGEDFREYMLLRLDGETWDSDEHAENTIKVDHTAEFEGWNVWKDRNKEGLDWEVDLRREDKTVSIHSGNLGIVIDARTAIRNDTGELYVALTGDQCALTNIRLGRCDPAPKGD